MLDIILNNYPFAKQAIFNHLWSAYQVSEAMYYRMNYQDKIMVIQGSLGFPVEVVDIDIVENNLYIYESIAMDYWFEIEDPLETFKNMDYNQREKYINWKSKINSSISLCINPLPILKSSVKISFRNCLQKINYSIEKEEESLNLFWQECIKQFSNHETVPF